MNRLFSQIAVSLIVSVLSISVYHLWNRQAGAPTHNEVQAAPVTQVVRQVSWQSGPSDSQQYSPVDFRSAATTAMPTVVHIKSFRIVSQNLYDPFYEFFGVRPRQYNNSRQQVSSGSGVIISPEGYIVTNNHVIEDAENLKVTLFDNREFDARVIGRDPSTDLGLIKITGGQLPFVELANSDEVTVGEWVLAVGNPFNLSSTATAGIVSAIGRDLEIIEDRMAIESFIQTDAAVNPGNSGGALVNLSGKLIGVNTAIASPTGAYAGYAFAVPANIVGKIVSDLQTYGVVQRGFLGIARMENLNGDLARQLGAPFSEGIVIEELVPGMGAAKAGLKAGDIIVSADNIPTRSESKLNELIGRSRPGDFLDLRFFRDGQYRNAKVQVTDANGSTSLKAVERSEALAELGLELRDLSDTELRRLGVERGVLISRLNAGKVRQQTDIRENFVVLKLNERTVSSAEELRKLLEAARGDVTLIGFYPGYGRLYSYSFKK
jgi:Do/DeqQ family serine protease